MKFKFISILWVLSFMCISLNVSCNQVKQIDSNSGNTKESGKQQEINKMDTVLLEAVPQDFKDSEKKAIERVLAHNPRLTFTDVASPIKVRAYSEDNLDNSKNTYIITGYSTYLTDKLVIFRKENNKLIHVWTSEKNVGAFEPFDISVKDIFHDGKKEIIIGGAASNSANNVYIYRWEGTSARLLGVFINYFDCRSGAVKGGNKLPRGTADNPEDDELVEYQCVESRIYKWDGHDYKLFKVVKAVPGTPLNNNE